MAGPAAGIRHRARVAGYPAPGPAAGPDRKKNDFFFDFFSFFFRFFSFFFDFSAPEASSLAKPKAAGEQGRVESSRVGR